MVWMPSIFPTRKTSTCEIVVAISAVTTTTTTTIPTSPKICRTEPTSGGGDIAASVKIGLTSRSGTQRGGECGSVRDRVRKGIATGLRVASFLSREGGGKDLLLDSTWNELNVEHVTPFDRRNICEVRV
jgi:hypothetical protein